MRTIRQRRACLTYFLVACFLPYAPLQLAADNSDNNSVSTNQLRAASAGNEAFTEPFETIKVASAETGIIASVNVRLGDVVREGDLLFELDMSVLEASRRLAKAKANNKARLRAAEVEFESKSKRYKQLVSLLQENAGSPKEVEFAKTQAEIARHGVEAILEESEQFGLETKRIESQIEQRRVRSPIAGVVIELHKKPGEFVSSNDPHLATIVRLDTLRVVFHLPTAQAIRLKRGDSAQIVLLETQQDVTALVDYVAPTTKADSGRVRVDVLIDNQLGQYRSGIRCRMLDALSRHSTIDNTKNLR